MEGTVYRKVGRGRVAITIELEADDTAQALELLHRVLREGGEVLAALDARLSPAPCSNGHNPKVE